MNFFKTVALSLALLSSTAGAALAQACSTEGGVINAALTTNASTLDPILSTTNASRQVGIYVFESLVTLDENYAVIPQLAQDWTQSEDKLTYTFTLRSGVTFHNGKVMTSADVKASLDRYMKLSPGADRFSAVSSIEAPDEQTVVITLSEDFPLLTNLAMPSPMTAIFPSEVVEAAGGEELRAENIIGTGPFRLVEWRPDVGIKLAKYDDYVTDDRFEGPSGFGGARIACVDEVNLLPVTEESSRVAGLQTGDFDFAEAIAITAVPNLETDPALKVEIVKPRWAIVIELDHNHPMMAKKPFRQALLAAINPEQALQAAAIGRPDFFRVQPSIFFPEQTQWYTEAGSEAYNAQNLDRVKELLEEAGYNDEPIPYLTNQNYGWMYRASQALAAQWQEAGINVQLELMDWPSQIERAQTRTDWALNQSGWSPRFDPFQVLSSLACGSVSAFGYCNEALAGDLATLNSGVSDEERKTAWDAVQKAVWDDVAVLRIGDYFEPEAIRTNLTGYVPFYTTPRFWNVSKAQ